MILASQVKGIFMKTEKMSPFTRSVYDYECEYLVKASQDTTLSGSIKTSLAGRVILLFASFVLHAEAVCTAVYICFLTIKQIFSQSTEELLKKKIEHCPVAMGLSVRSFGAVFHKKLIADLDMYGPVINIHVTPQSKHRLKAPQPIETARPAAPQMRIAIPKASNLERIDEDPYLDSARTGSESSSDTSFVRVNNPGYDSPKSHHLFEGIDPVVDIANNPIELRVPLSPKHQPPVRNQNDEALAGSEPSEVEAPLSPRLQQPAAKKNDEALAGSEPSEVEAPHSPKLQQPVAKQNDEALAGSEPSEVEAPLSPSILAKDKEESNKGRNLKKRSSGSEIDYILVGEEDLQRMREDALLANSLYLDVERIEEEKRVQEELKAQLEKALKEAEKLRARLAQKEKAEMDEILALEKSTSQFDQISDDGVMINILKHCSEEDDAVLERIAQGKPGSDNGWNLT